MIGFSQALPQKNSKKTLLYSSKASITLTTLEQSRAFEH